MLKINRERLLRNIRAQGEIGWVPGKGLCREAFTEDFRKARAFVQGILEEAGIPTRVDPVGNLFGRLAGENTDAVLLGGSHLDSVRAGGILDGAYGVIAAVEAALTLKENGRKLHHSFEVAGFNSEEGSDLGGTFGSRAFCGMIPEPPAGEILEAYGITAADIAAAKGKLEAYRAYLEVHIEQGTVLHNRGYTIGVPEAIAGITRFACTVTGRANHAGTTPMADRKDALYETMKSLSKWMDAMQEETEMVCNVGYMHVEPGHICVVPEKTEFVVEIRAVEQADVDRAAERLQACLGEIRTCETEARKIISKRSARLDDGICGDIYDCGTAAGYPTMRMISGASHDASPISHVMPAGLIFVPSIAGVSHAMDEATDDDDLVKGAQVYLDSLIALDKRLR